ncbi:hypothetical protein [Spongiactinospora sp. 9N601]|uniref:hypothetical protein n=1 Tax=Spongiactinospora sp. 9N601 TaxID=3375149 RepID=UPI0037A7EAE9
MTETVTPRFLGHALLVSGLDPRVVAWGKTAAHLWGIDTAAARAPAEPWPMEFIVPPGFGDPPGCLVREGGVADSDVTTHLGVRLTGRERTAIDCALHLPRLEAVTVLDQFLHAGLAESRLAARVAALRREGDRRRVRSVLALADGGAASPRETWIRLALCDAGLPAPRTQIPVRLPGGDRTCYLDLGWEEFRLATEYDGEEHHTATADRRHDEVRRAGLRELGWRIIPVRRDVIPARTADYIEIVANALLERGWKPSHDHLLAVMSRVRAARRRPP